MGGAPHPWLTSSDALSPFPSVSTIERPTGAMTPQPGVIAPDSADRLPRRQIDRTGLTWCLGVHGGAGESTMSALLSGAQPAQHAWPWHPSAPTTVLLVARSNMGGLLAAQRAAADWSAGSVPGVRLIGLVIVADVPGRRPPMLRALVRRIGGGVPRVWELPWVERWRLGEPVRLAAAPASVRFALADISRHIVAHT
jgi:hypothetical protein